MATYKVPQDVEAEDKLIGFLSFRQFIFVGIGIAFGAATFFGFRAGFFFGFPFIIPTAIFMILGLYQPKDQPVETKLVALVNFFFRSRKRIWNRDGISQHLIIKAPKRVERNYADTRTRSEVKSQLKMLAQIIDTRGWSVKRSEIQLPGAVGTMALMPDDDRLVNPTQFQPGDDPLDIHEFDDIMDESTNPVAQSFDVMASATVEEARNEALATIASAQRTPSATPLPPSPPLPSQLKPLPTKVKFQPFPTSIHQNVIQPLRGSVHPVSQTTNPPQPKAAIPVILNPAPNQVSKSVAKASELEQPDIEEGEQVSLH